MNAITIVAALLFAIAQPNPADLAAIAGKLPPLESRDGVVAVPLADQQTYPWRAFGDGVTLTQAGGALRASYRVAAGKPAGAALLVPPGALAGVKAVRVRVAANRNTNLIVSLQDRKGVAYSFPSIAARAGTRSVELSVDDLSFLPQQSQAADPGSFDMAGAILITVTDISGFMSAETPEVTWTIDSLEGVR